jgi:hypothetical protein
MESIALTPLEQLNSSLDAVQTHQAFQTLESINEKSESLEETFRREAAFSAKLGWSSRIAIMLAFKTFHPERSQEQKVTPQWNALERRSRQLMIDLAARAYTLEKGTTPRTFADLIPAYLKTIPIDPVTGANWAQLSSP